MELLMRSTSWDSVSQLWEMLTIPKEPRDLGCFWERKTVNLLLTSTDYIFTAVGHWLKAVSLNQLRNPSQASWGCQPSSQKANQSNPLWICVQNFTKQSKHQTHQAVQVVKTLSFHPAVSCATPRLLPNLITGEDLQVAICHFQALHVCQKEIHGIDATCTSWTWHCYHSAITRLSKVLLLGICLTHSMLRMFLGAAPGKQSVWEA